MDLASFLTAFCLAVVSLVWEMKSYRNEKDRRSLPLGLEKRMLSQVEGSRS